jgi:MFS family permease
MFLGGLLPLIILFYVNYIVPESPIYSALKRRGEVTKTPVRDFFSRRSGLLKLFIIALLVTISWGGLYYATIGLYPTFLAVVNKLPKAEIGYIMLLSSVAMIIGPTLGGEISQHIGRKLMSIIGSVIVIAISFLYLHLGMLPPSAFDLILAEAVIISLLSDFGGGIVMTYLNEVYPGRVRSTGVSFTWNTGFAIGAAITIVGVPALVAMYGIKAFPSLEVEIIILLAVIGLIAMIFSPETRGNIERERQALGV